MDEVVRVRVSVRFGGVVGREGAREALRVEEWVLGDVLRDVL